MNAGAGQTLEIFHTADYTFGPVVVRCDERVLTPRPWTLMQSEWAADLATSAQPGALLELCAGAGHIGLAAAALCGRPLVQVESDEIAAGFAQQNAESAGLAQHVDIRHAPMESALTRDEQFAIVLADPPYLPSEEIGRWPDDPTRAIDGGADGLDLVRTCVHIASQHLLSGGALLLQVAGAAQADTVVTWLAQLPELGLEHRETRSHDAERAVLLLTATRP